MDIARFCEAVDRDERFVCERDDTRSIVTVWSTQMRRPIPIAPVEAVSPATYGRTSRVDYEVDEPGDGAGSKCITIDQHSIDQPLWGWHQWREMLERELRKRRDSRDTDTLLLLAGQVIDGFPDMVTCGNRVGFDLIRQIATVLGRSDEFLHRLKVCGMTHWLEGR